MVGIATKPVTSFYDIWSLSAKLLQEVQLLVMATRNSLAVPKERKGDMDEALEKILGDFTSYVRQYEAEFLHLMARHVNLINPALNALLAKSKRGERVDPKLIQGYSSTLGKIRKICNNVERAEVIDIQKAKFLAYDARNLKASVQRKVNEADNALVRLQRKQEEIIRKQRAALRGKKH